MSDDSIVLKVQLDTSDLENQVGLGITNGVKKSKGGILREAKDLRQQLLRDSADLSGQMFSSDPDVRKDSTKRMRVNTAAFKELNKLIGSIYGDRQKSVEHARHIELFDKKKEVSEQNKRDRIEVINAAKDAAIQKSAALTADKVKLVWEETAADIDKKTKEWEALYSKRAEEDARRHDFRTQEISDKLNAKVVADADHTNNVLKIQADRAANAQAARDDRAAKKKEEDDRRLENAKEKEDYREASRKRLIALQEANRAQRANGTLSGLFGGLLGQIIDFPSSIRDSKQFAKDFDLGARMAGRMKTLHPDYDPYADPNASAGFRAGFTGKSKIAGVLGKAIPAIAAVIAIIKIFKKFVLDPMIKVGKKVVGYFVDIAKQTETLQALFNLIALPFKIIFTLGFIGPLMAFIPVLKEMINWITENKEVIQSISDTLARVFTDVFTEDRMGIVNELLDRFAGVLQFLADSLATNMSTVNTSNVAAFIGTTITSVIGLIQDVLMGIVAFCYSPEGQAFIISMAEGIGRLIGTLIDLLIAMLPIFIEMAVFTISGIVQGIISTVWKAFASLLDIIDDATGGALTGFVNGILSLANWFIDRINDAIGFINSINPFGQIDKLGRMDMWGTGSTGSNFRTAATNFWNTSNSYSSIFFVTNNNQLSNSDTMRNLMMTGL